MKRLALAVLLAGAMNAATAQPPEIVEMETELNVPLGYTEVIKFGDAFDTIRVMSKGIVEASALTDRTMTLTGLGLGSTAVFVYDKDGNQLYGTRVTVGSDAPGHRVQIHAKKNTHEYYAYYCTQTKCRRIKDDLEGAPPEETKTTVTYPNGATTTRTLTSGYR